MNNDIIIIIIISFYYDGSADSYYIRDLDTESKIQFEWQLHRDPPWEKEEERMVIVIVRVRVRVRVIIVKVVRGTHFFSHTFWLMVCERLDFLDYFGLFFPNVCIGKRFEWLRYYLDDV